MERILLIAKLLPVIIGVIKSIEEAIPGQSKGEAKLAAAREILEAVDAGVSQLWPTIEKVIGALVKVFNATGVFQK